MERVLANLPRMPTIALTNARVFDGVNEACPEGMSVLVEGDRIREVSDKALKADRTIDCGGRTLMPGLIDAHFHAYACLLYTSDAADE